MPVRDERRQCGAGRAPAESNAADRVDGPRPGRWTRWSNLRVHRPFPWGERRRRCSGRLAAPPGPRRQQGVASRPAAIEADRHPPLTPRPRRWQAPSTTCGPSTPPPWPGRSYRPPGTAPGLPPDPGTASRRRGGGSTRMAAAAKVGGERRGEGGWRRGPTQCVTPVTAPLSAVLRHFQKLTAGG
jgi:hypothetical protein